MKFETNKNLKYQLNNKNKIEIFIPNFTKIQYKGCGHESSYQKLPLMK